MTEASSPEYRRAQHVAGFGFILQLAALGTLLGISIFAESQAVAAGARFILPGLPIWLILYLVFKQLRRVRAELLETIELRRAQEAGTSSAMFELEDEALLLEQNRLRWMVKWLLPSVTIAMVLILFVGHFVAWGWSLESVFKPVGEGGLKRAAEPTMIMWFVVGVGFACFLFARYCIGLAQLPDRRLLHAGATYMAGNALVCLVLAVALGAGAATTADWTEPLIAYVIRVALIVLGLELTANYILDLYRPRQPDIVTRPSFDSRLLGLIGEPGDLAKSIADAFNYQFGFEVSSTWFYQLLQRWLFPITVFTAFVVWVMTSIVIVRADEEAIVERFGRPGEGRAGVLTPGINLKWPYPIDVVRRAPVKRIGELVIGEARDEEDDHEHKAVLWTEAHEYIPELMMLVAAPSGAGRSSASPDAGSGIEASTDATKSVAVSLLMISIPIEYRIRDIDRYLYNYTEPVKLMEAVAYQYLSDYAASVDIDVFMGPGRQAINRHLREQLQRRLDDLDVGIEIVFVGVRGAHPPAKDNVAAAFHSAVSALTVKQSLINAAEGQAREILTSVAGTESSALALDEAIQEKDRLETESAPDTEALARAKQRVENLLIGSPEEGIEPLSGEAAVVIASAQAEASRLTSQWATKALAFSTELAAFEASPTLYKQRKVLQMYRDLDHVRKYLILGDPDNVIIIYDTEGQAGLDRVLSEGEQRERDRRQ